MQLPGPGQAGDYAAPLLKAFLQLEKEHGREVAAKEANLLLTSLLLRFDLTHSNLASASAAPASRTNIVPVNPRALAAPPVEQPSLEPIPIPSKELLPKSLCIFYGSYTRTCENLANRLYTEAQEYGLNVVELKTLDALTGRIPKDLTVIIITSTIHGGPPPNARNFVNWLTGLSGDVLKGTNFAVFGSGAGKRATYQANPIRIYDTMVKLGANPILPRGEGNAEGSTRRDFALWKKEYFWPYFNIKFPPLSTAVQLSVEDVKVDPEFAYELRTGQVVKNVELTKGNDPTAVKRHITIKLPKDMKYTTGDYLSVLPVNPRESTKRAMARFKLDFTKVLNIRRGGLVLPEGKNISPWRVFSQYVELGRLALEGDIEIIAGYAKGETKETLEGYLKDKAVYDKEIFEKRVSPLELLERFPEIDIGLDTFLSILPPIEHRRYSISSSPLPDPTICTLTIGILNDKAKCGAGWFHGVASTYLSRMQEEFTLEVGTVDSEEFRLPGPEEQEKTPIIMICAGTGLAPFRGFVQERAHIKTQNPGLKLAEALLFIGCRYFVDDRLHAEELDQWEKDGVVKLRYAFSQETGKSRGARYVQNRLEIESEEIKPLLAQGARIYICGSGKIGEQSKGVLGKMMKDMGMSDEEIADVFDKRLHEDVFD